MNSGVVRIRRVVLVVLLASSGLGAAVPAWAGDGETPAEETICDGLSGASWGLCTAFCEAMDCESENPQASANACAKVLERYRQKSGGTSPPCLDTDGDGILDEDDICPYAADPLQLDVGGVDSPSNPGGLVPDGIGDACQCGDLDDNAIVAANDLALARQVAVGATPSVPVVLEKCSVIGPGDGEIDCNVLDLGVLERALQDLPPGISQVCPAAVR